MKLTLTLLREIGPGTPDGATRYSARLPPRPTTGDARRWLLGSFQPTPGGGYGRVTLIDWAKNEVCLMPADAYVAHFGQ